MVDVVAPNQRRVNPTDYLCWKMLALVTALPHLKVQERQKATKQDSVPAAA